MPVTFRILVVALLIIGCGDEGTQPAARDAYERWQSYKLHDYTVDRSRVCFCMLGGETVRVTVRADTVSAVMQLSDSSLVPSPYARNYLSVDALFGIIRKDAGDSLVVTYNGTYGYPESLDINPQLHPVDGGVLYTTSNLRIP